MNVKKATLTRSDFLRLLSKILEDRRRNQFLSINFTNIYPDMIDLFLQMEILIQRLQQGSAIFSKFEDDGFRKGTEINNVLESLINLPKLPNWKMICKNGIRSNLILRFHESLENFFNTIPSNSLASSSKEIQYKKFLLQLQEEVIAQPKEYYQDNLSSEHQKLHQEIYDSINQQVSIAGLIFVVALKIKIDYEARITSPDYQSFKLQQLEDGLNALHFVNGIISCYYKPFMGLNNSIEYFAILTIQDVEKKFNEKVVVEEAKQGLRRAYSSNHSEVIITVENLNPKFREIRNLDYNYQFFLSNYSHLENEKVCDWFFGFLFEFEKFSVLETTSFLGIQERKLYDQIYIENFNLPKATITLYSVRELGRYEKIWRSEHLSAYAKTYLENIKIIYKGLAATNLRVASYQSTLNQIELFMLTIKESPILAFEDAITTRRGKKWKNDSVQEHATRSLLQFVQLFDSHDLIIKMIDKIERTHCSCLAQHFLKAYAENTIEIRKVLGADIQDKNERYKIHLLLSRLRYHREIFLTTAINKKENDATALNRLIDIPRHMNRASKIQLYLDQAMKTDVVIIRCIFTCDINKRSVEQSDLSKILSKMLHAGKRRAPLSQITAYLGFWSGVIDQDDTYGHFSADISFIFKKQAMLTHRDLFEEIKNAWQVAAEKFFEGMDSSLSLIPHVKEEIVLPSLDQFKSKLVLIETINSPLKKDFIKAIVPLVVYKDLLNDDFYRSTSKWLIRGVGPKPKRKKVKQSSNALPDKIAQLIEDSTPVNNLANPC